MRSKTRASSLALVTNVKVAKTNTSFLAFKALDTYLNSVLFITVVIRDLTYIPLPLFVVTNLCLIDSGGQGSEIPLNYMLFLLLVYPGLIGRL